MTVSVGTLWAVSTAAQILEFGLDVARVVGLPVSTWRTGDPTKALFKFLAEILAEREGITVEFVRAGFLSTASGDWLTLLASELYGVERVAATYATSTLTLANAGGGYYSKRAGEISFKSSINGKTYHSTSAVNITGLGTYTVTIEADEPGTAWNAGANEINSIITTMLGVSVTASTAATAQDSQDDESLREQCRATLGALSPNGPPDAYEYVVRNPTLTGTTEVTRAAAAYDSTTGDVIVYIAGASGAVSGGAITAAQAAVEQWAEPLCITPTVTNASALTVAVTADITGEDLPGDYVTLASAAVSTLMHALPMKATVGGSLVGPRVTRSAIIAALQAVATSAGATNVSVDLTLPDANVQGTIGQVVIPGVITLTTGEP